MFTYNFTFGNYNRGAKTVKNLDEMHATAVAYMTNLDYVTWCEITTPTGAISIVRKDGSHHWNHNGYSFGFVPAEQAEAYRASQKHK